MKKLFFLLITTIILAVSCKKEGTIITQFSAARSNGPIVYDSISYAIINYSEANEVLGDTSVFLNPEIFSHSERVEKPFTLALKAEHTYVLKKFDIFDNSGNLLYYVPYSTQLNFNKFFTLPFIFKAIDGSYQLNVIKKNNN
jgi:hypothetical protein